MKSALVASAALLAFTAIATSACAQRDRGPPVDANGDGKITLDEMKAVAAQFAAGGGGRGPGGPGGPPTGGQ